ncbi:MAG TPA: multifunctional CCA addition/repair protein [Burkholderiales bacterium]|nr:multifunctional CCA addition/repair protein [Burkholderiales bacterium]
MQIYEVGGAVRDELLGRAVQDRDFVVVGATPDEMVRRGFKPVGRDFPVFLHPETHEEYALARTERKVARGYRGFEFHADPDVTLEQDLARRDLTINAIARDGDGKLIDPFGGVADLKAGILRHVGPAFAEDPVRILRVARFAARLGFAIAPETLQLMRQMVDNGEVDALVPERVWQELARGLMEQHPSRMFLTLRKCGAAAHILPEVDRLFGVPQPAAHHPEIDTGVHVMMVIDYAAAQGFALEVRFAALTHDLGKGVTPHEQWPRHIGHEQKSVELVRQLCERIRVPADCRDLALLAARDHGNVHRALELRHATLLDLLERSDALRRPQRFEQLLQACEADYRGRTGFEQRPYPQAERLRAALAAIAAVDAGAIAHTCDDPAKIPVKIREARLAAIRAALPANTNNKESS